MSIRIRTMRKSCLLVLLVAAVFLQGLSATEQKIYPVDSWVYETISDIYLLTGHAMPSSSGPWSEAELLDMIRAIPESSVPEVMKENYLAVLDELEGTLPVRLGEISMRFSADLALELYAHTNTDGETRTDLNEVTEKSFVGRDNWAYDLVHSDPIFQFNWEIDVSDFFYLTLEAPVKSGFHNGTGYEQEIGNSGFGSNIPGLQNIPVKGDFSLSLDANWPYRAFGSFGGKSWNVQIGRDRISWGLGKTGNLGISDNLPYHDMLKLSAFSGSFKYTFLMSSFPHKENYYDPGYQGSNKKGLIEKSPIIGTSLYLAHRIEGRVLQDRLAFSITEAIMYASDSGVLDFRIFNPATIFHNFYTPSNTNSTMILELDWTPVNGLNLYGQFLLDDFAIPGGEDGAGPTSKGYPNGLGYLAGAKYATPAGSGLLTFNLEGVLVDPYTYLRYCSNPNDASSEAYGLDYVVPVRTYVTGSGKDSLVYDEYFLGYRYGGDCIVSNLNIEWKKPGKMALSSNIFFMAHGTHDKWTRWDQIGKEGEEAWSATSVTPTTKHETGNYRYDGTGGTSNAKDRDAVCYTLDIGVGFSYVLDDGLRFFCQADFVQIWNSFNEKGQDEHDFQVVSGIKYTL